MIIHFLKNYVGTRGGIRTHTVEILNLLPPAFGLHGHKTGEYYEALPLDGYALTSRSSECLAAATKLHWKYFCVKS